MQLIGRNLCANQFNSRCVGRVFLWAGRSAWYTDSVRPKIARLAGPATGPCLREGTNPAPYGRGFKSRPVHHGTVVHLSFWIGLMAGKFAGWSFWETVYRIQVVGSCSFPV